MFFLCLNPLVGSCRLWSELRASWPGFSLSLCLLSAHCCSHGSFCPQSSRLVPPEVIPACPPPRSSRLVPPKVIPACPQGLGTAVPAPCSALFQDGVLFPPPAALFSRTRWCLSSAERPLPPTLNENPCVSLRLGTGALRPPYRPFFLVLLLAVCCLI